MAKGKTISVTLPGIVVELYDKKAKDLGVSRSSILGTVIMNDYDKQKEKVNDVTTSNITQKSS